MHPLTARAIYSVGLCFLAACAVLPEPAPVTTAPAISVQAQPTVAQRLAAATRDRVEANRIYGPKHPAAIKAIAAETALRAFTGSLGERDDFHREFVAALSNELATAMTLRTQASTRYGAKHPEMLRAETLVRDLTIALNAEVRSHS